MTFLQRLYKIVSVMKKVSNFAESKLFVLFGKSTVEIWQIFVDK